MGEEIYIKEPETLEVRDSSLTRKEFLRLIIIYSHSKMSGLAIEQGFCWVVWGIGRDQEGLNRRPKNFPKKMDDFPLENEWY